MANALKLYISPENKRLLAGPGAFVSATTPVFYSGNSIEVELHLMEGAGVARAPYEVPFPPGASIKLAVGTVATRPTAGTWRLSVLGTETSDLAYNATAASVQTALNAIGAVSSAGGVTVSALGDGYSITWNTFGTKPLIVAGTDELVPSSYESIYILQAGSPTEREIVFAELRQSPVALATTFSPIGTPVVTATTVSAWNGVNKVVRILLDPAPQSGTYTITFGTAKAAVNANGNATDIRTALISAGVTAIDTVSQSGQQQFDIVFTANNAVSVDGSGLIARMGVVGTLDLATSEILAYLGSASTAGATLEIIVTSAGEENTVCQVPCTVANGVVTPGAVSPVTAGVILTESVANARYIRRDAAQSPSGADLDVIWPNLGVTIDGSDLAAALSAANSPASGNPIATMADIPASPDLSAYLLSATAASTYQTLAGMSAYLTTSSASSTYQTLSGMSSYLTTSSASSTYQTISGMSSYLTTSAAASTYLSISTASSTYAPLTDFDQSVKTTSDVEFAQLTCQGLTLNPFVGTGLITFSDSTTQNSAPVPTTGTVIHSGGGGHIDAADYPDEVTINIGGVTYAMPARVI